MLKGQNLDSLDFGITHDLQHKALLFSALGHPTSF